MKKRGSIISVLALAMIFSVGGCAAGTAADLMSYDAIEAAAGQAQKGVTEIGDVPLLKSPMRSKWRFSFGIAINMALLSKYQKIGERPLLGRGRVSPSVRDCR